jgi:hypothetical protein
MAPSNVMLTYNINLPKKIYDVQNQLGTHGTPSYNYV